MDKLRVDSGIKNIEVNDAGEYISIPINDTAFYERFGALMKNFEKKEEEYNQKAKELSERHKDKPDDDVDMIVDGIGLYSSLAETPAQSLTSFLEKDVAGGCLQE